MKGAFSLNNPFVGTVRPPERYFHNGHLGESLLLCIFTVSELRKACFRHQPRLARVAQAVLPPGALFHAGAFALFSFAPKSHMVLMSNVESRAQSQNLIFGSCCYRGLKAHPKSGNTKIRKLLVSAKFLSAILGPEMGASILWTPGKMRSF